MQGIYSSIFGLTSKSEVKLKALNKFLDKYNIKCTNVKYMPTGTEQPLGVNNTFKCANKRFTTDNEHRFVISVENGIYEKGDSDVVFDVCAVVIKDNVTGKTFDNKQDIVLTEITVPNGNNLLKKIINMKSKNGLGLTKTIGELLHLCHDVPSDDWMGPLRGVPRSAQIEVAIKSLWDNFMRESILSHTRLVTDFPKAGMLFQDFMPILYSFQLRKFMNELLINELSNLPKGVEIDLVVGPELKGCLFSQGVADSLKKGFIPLRLKGTLPTPKVVQNNSKKYRSEQALEMDTSEFNPLANNTGMNVLLIDYVKDTGDSIKKMINLIEKTGNNVVYWLTISDVPQRRQLADKALSGHSGSTVFN